MNKFKNAGWLKIIFYYYPRYMWFHYIRFIFKPLYDNNLLHDFYCGRHSGFRFCCILYYVFWHLFRAVGNLKGNRVLVKNWNAWHDKSNPKAQYIECPICLHFKREPIKFKECGCGEVFEKMKEEERVARSPIEALR